MDHPLLPTAQQLLSSVVHGLRLNVDDVDVSRRTSASTRKSVAAGERVKPSTLTAYVYAVAEALNNRQLLMPLARGPLADVRQNDDAVARGIGEFALAWEECVSDAKTFNPVGARSHLAVLPLVRLGLTDLGVRWACRSLSRGGYLLEADVASVRDALVSGLAFIELTRFSLKGASLRRVDLVEAFNPDTVRGWEEGALPTEANLLKLQRFFEEKGKVEPGLELDLRLAVALCELWHWLRGIDTPPVALARMAEGFLVWMRWVAVASTKERIGEQELMWTIVRGARHPIVGYRLASVADVCPDHRFALDLRALGDSWVPRVRADVGPLADFALAAADERAGRGPADVDTALPDEHLLAVTLSLPANPWAAEVAGDVLPADSAAAWEAAGTAALHAGDLRSAVRALRRAVTLAPSDAWPRAHLARALQLQGDLGAAEAMARSAIVLDGSISDAHLVLGSIYLDADKHADALECLVNAKHNSQQPAVVSAYCARTLAAMGRLDEAARACEEGIDLAKDNSECWLLLAKIRQAQGQTHEAKQAMKMAAHLGVPATELIIPLETPS